MADLFDMKLRGARRDRAARTGAELFLFERAFEDCLDRLRMMQRSFERALIIGCPDSSWPDHLRTLCAEVQVGDPGMLFAKAAGGDVLVEEAWLPPPQSFDLILAIGTLDTVNDLPLALRIFAHALRPDGLLIGAIPGGETLPRLREAMRAADLADGAAAPHVHPRIEPSALASLLSEAGFRAPVVDIDRVTLSYASLRGLIRDLRGMAATNVLTARPRYVSKLAYAAAQANFAADDGNRTAEIVEILHFAGRGIHQS